MTAGRRTYLSVASLLLLAAACTPAPPAGPAFALLTPNFGEAVVTVLLPGDRVDGGTATSSWFVDDPEEALFGVDGLSLGPDGRLYVSDYYANKIYVVDPADFTADGAITPVATISSADLSGPSQGSFDDRGRFWVGNWESDTIVRFDALTDVAGSESPVDLSADFVLRVDSDGGTYSTFSEVMDVFFDSAGDMWVAGEGPESVFRFDIEVIGDLEGEKEVVPSLEIYASRSEDSQSGWNVYAPTAVWVTDDGTLYVGTEADQVSRFDDAVSLSGIQNIEADAYLSVGADGAYASMLLIDDDGALWIAYDEGELFKITDPSSYTGAVNVRDDAALILSWSEEGGPTKYLDGGRLTFVPIEE